MFGVLDVDHIRYGGATSYDLESSDHVAKKDPSIMPSGSTYNQDQGQVI
jgi:hypothetical protein